MNTKLQNNWRQWLVYSALGGVLALIGYRAVELQVLEKDFLINQGTARMERVDTLTASRGLIVDRNGKPLAISTPLTSLWANPGEMDYNDLPQISELTGVPLKTLRYRYKRSKAFMYVRRRMVPEEANRILARKIKGLYGDAEYQRFYPAGETTAQLVGLTDIDHRGQEGLELGYDSYLTGENGQKKVLKDLYGRVIRDVESIKETRNGKDLVLSIDLDIQYIAYRELLKAVRQHRAKSGSLVLLDVHTGDVLAMVNQPSFNPNNRSTIIPGSTRNRAATDAFEPGSVIKTLTMAAALETGKFTLDQKFNTSPGYRRINGRTIRDTHNYGILTFSKVLEKSSNIGASAIALSIGPEQMFNTFFKLGLGHDTGLGIPGESAGILPNRPKWRDIELATMSYGYGLTVTPLQLAVAYAAIANHGRKVQPHLILNNSQLSSEQVVSPETADKVVTMLERVVEQGTGSRAQSDFYRMAGKTGTVHKVVNGKYAYDRYVASFAGLAPASNPRLAMIVSVDDPAGNAYYGGEVAAPVFKSVMEQALQHLGVPPDKPGSGEQMFLARDFSGGSRK